MDSRFRAMLELTKAALAEDVGLGDMTSLACLEPEPMRARITAKSKGILSGLKPALLTHELVDSANSITVKLSDGSSFSPGDTILEIDGFNRTILTAERVSLNFLARLSGIATLTGRFVRAVEKYDCRIIDTRKTTPGWRCLEKEAVLHGGGSNHRMGLYDMILIKDNHIASCGSISKAVTQAREFLDTPDFRLQFKAKGDDISIEVEVSNEAELREALDCGVKKLLLDNQSPQSLKAMVSIARKFSSGVALEASGNVTLNNVGEIAASGVDYISIGALTHSAPASDFSLKALD